MGDRAQRLIELLGQHDLDAMLVTRLPNVRYLTGYTGSNGIAVIGPKTRVFVTDFRYVTQAAREVDPAFDRLRAPTELLETLVSALPDDPVRLGFEDGAMTVRQHQHLRGLLPDRVELIAAGSPVESLRRVKEPAEVEAIRAAAGLADEAFSRVLEQGLTGRSEREVALAIDRTMEDLGAAGPSFETIVAAGAHGASPHASPGAEKLVPGDLVVIDWGARLHGYCSDCTRTVAVERIDGEAKEVYELVLEAQLAGLAAAGPGASTRAVDSAARAVIERDGHGEHFGHSLGHGVGIEVHEAPRLSQRSDETLEPGNIVTVEPGIYLPDRFGVRIEDLVLVTPDGPETLNSLAKDLILSD